jgi:hypothetical protein
MTGTLPLQSLVSSNTVEPHAGLLRTDNSVVVAVVVVVVVAAVVVVV